MSLAMTHIVTQVDDTIMNSALGKTMLEKLNCSVTLAYDGEESFSLTLALIHLPNPNYYWRPRPFYPFMIIDSFHHVHLNALCPYRGNLQCTLPLSRQPSMYSVLIAATFNALCLPLSRLSTFTVL